MEIKGDEKIKKIKYAFDLFKYVYVSNTSHIDLLMSYRLKIITLYE